MFLSFTFNQTPDWKIPTHVEYKIFLNNFPINFLTKRKKIGFKAILCLSTNPDTAAKMNKGSWKKRRLLIFVNTTLDLAAQFLIVVSIFQYLFILFPRQGPSKLLYKLPDSCAKYCENHCCWTWKEFPSLSKRSWATESGKPSGKSDLRVTKFLQFYAWQPSAYFNSWLKWWSIVDHFSCIKPKYGWDDNLNSFKPSAIFNSCVNAIRERWDAACMYVLGKAVS